MRKEDLPRVRPQTTPVLMGLAVFAAVLTVFTGLIVYGFTSRPQVDYYLAVNNGNPPNELTYYGQPFHFDLEFRNSGGETAVLVFTVTTVGATVACGNANATSCRWEESVEKGGQSYGYYDEQVTPLKNQTSFEVKISISKGSQISFDGFVTLFADIRPDYPISATYNLTGNGLYKLTSSS